MTYNLNKVTICTDNSENGIAKINSLWADIMSGKIPLLFDTEGNAIKGICPISIYSNYVSDETGAYDLTIQGVTPNFFEDMEKKVKLGEFVKFETIGETIQQCAVSAWEKVWEQSAKGELKRAFSQDFESTVPKEFSKDGKSHCYLYISV